MDWNCLHDNERFYFWSFSVGRPILAWSRGSPESSRLLRTVEIRFGPHPIVC